MSGPVSHLRLDLPHRRDTHRRTRCPAEQYQDVLRVDSKYHRSYRHAAEAGSVCCAFHKNEGLLESVRTARRNMFYHAIQNSQDGYRFLRSLNGYTLLIFESMSPLRTRGLPPSPYRCRFSDES